MSNDRLGHLGYVLLLAGMIMLASDVSLGWAPRLVGELLWIAVGFRMRMSSVWSWGILFCIIDIYGLWRALT